MLFMAFESSFSAVMSEKQLEAPGTDTAEAVPWLPLGLPPSTAPLPPPLPWRPQGWCVRGGGGGGVGWCVWGGGGGVGDGKEPRVERRPAGVNSVACLEFMHHLG